GAVTTPSPNWPRCRSPATGTIGAHDAPPGRLPLSQALPRGIRGLPRLSGGADDRAHHALPAAAGGLDLLPPDRPRHGLRRAALLSALPAGRRGGTAPLGGRCRRCPPGVDPAPPGREERRHRGPAGGVVGRQGAPAAGP